MGWGHTICEGRFGDLENSAKKQDCGQKENIGQFYNNKPWMRDVTVN